MTEECPALLRQYSITNDQDAYNVMNGRCPDYALNWLPEVNARYWEPNHDYFIGTPTGLTAPSASPSPSPSVNPAMECIRRILSEKLHRNTLPSQLKPSFNRLIFCDLDGVLTNFDAGVIRKFKKAPHQLPAAVMWSQINKSTDFFQTLPWMPQGQLLWNLIRPYGPIIITGIPRGNKTAAEQKRQWCATNLGPDIHVITCATKDKPNYCIHGAILIDDRADLEEKWNQAGGKFILYNESTFDSNLIW